MKSNNSYQEIVVEGYEDSDENILKEIKKVKEEIEKINVLFENVVEPNLIDSCIYELRAIQSKYAYLLRIAKERNIISKINKR